MNYSHSVLEFWWSRTGYSNSTCNTKVAQFPARSLFWLVSSLPGHSEHDIHSASRLASSWTVAVPAHHSSSSEAQSRAQFSVWNPVLGSRSAAMVFLNSALVRAAATQLVASLLVSFSKKKRQEEYLLLCQFFPLAPKHEAAQPIRL